MLRMWSAVSLPPLSIRNARLSLNPESFKRESQSGGKPTALHKLEEHLYFSQREHFCLLIALYPMRATAPFADSNDETVLHHHR